MVGEPGAGKTSLAKKIQDPDYQLLPREPSTEGIDIVRWQFPTALRFEEGGEEQLLERQFRVNIWDFGVQERQGHFTRDDLAGIWYEEEYSPVRAELLRLMQKFQLCYELPEGGGYIAAQLLTAAAPDHPWDRCGNLVVRYRYEFMPKGIVTRFIVAVHDLIAAQELVWRSGTVLERDGTRARVIENWPGRAITVRLAGPDPRSLFAIVDRELEKIHASFPKLVYDRYLPCGCALCSQREEPYLYSLTELRDFAQTGHGIQCRVSRELVDAAELPRDRFRVLGEQIHIPGHPFLFDIEVYRLGAEDDDSRPFATEVEDRLPDLPQKVVLSE